MKFDIAMASKVKLIIWDLDETFWRGTLSDYDSSPEVIPINFELVKKTTNRGIVNSICSKNERNAAKDKLESMGVWDFFVFASINWEPKGNRIKKNISDMALRPENVLYLDDNPTNLAEAEFIIPQIMVAAPDIIPELFAVVDQLGRDDFEHSRLQQYKVIEKKRKDAESYSSNLEFLVNSNIRIRLSQFDESYISRIAELIQRSNQLNFTKKRIGEEELKTLLKNKNYQMGVIDVTDNYGKYGIVGFYALDKKRQRLEHYLFSCRIMGMGIEQYVYALLDYPEISIVDPVSGYISKDAGTPEYITLVDEITNKKLNKEIIKLPQFKMLLKGPCDLEVMASYLEKSNITLVKEFNFIDHIGNQADYGNHFINIINDNKVIDEWCKNYSFLSKEGFSTSLFSEEYDAVCLSPLMDATLAVYDDGKNHQLAYGLYSIPLCEKDNHRRYLDKRVMTARSDFCEEELLHFAEEFTQINYTAEMVIENLVIIIKRILSKNRSTKIIVLLLGELEYKSQDKEYRRAFENKHIIHKEINDQLRNTFANNESVYLLDVNNYIHCQEDYFDNINHYSKLVYYQMAQEFAGIFERQFNTKISTTPKSISTYQNIKQKIYKKLFVGTNFTAILYNSIRPHIARCLKAKKPRR